MGGAGCVCGGRKSSESTFKCVVASRSDLSPPCKTDRQTDTHTLYLRMAYLTYQEGVSRNAEAGRQV
jgi:hypothetical protein